MELQKATVNFFISKSILILFLSFLVTSCKNEKFEVNPSALQRPDQNVDDTVNPPAEIKACIVNGFNSASCILSKNSFFYLEENGGRNPERTEPLVFSSAAQINIPEGWYPSAVTATFDEPNLKAENIRKGTNLFGVVGTLETDKPPACDLEASPLATTQCLLSKGLYLYSQSFGGRGNVCDPQNKTKLASCWLDTTATFYLSKTEVNPVNECSASDIDTSTPLAGDCWTQPSVFLYNSKYGGRSTLCKTDESVNPTACWAEQISETNRGIIASSTTQKWCQWNEATTELCKVRINVTINPGDSPTPASLPYGYVYQEPYGSRNVFCIKDAAGKCWLGVEKSQLESNLKPEVIKAGVSIFGILGKFRGEGSWKSGAHRDLVTTPLSISDESFVYGGERNQDSGFSDGYREVPWSEVDDDGTYSQSVLPVDRTGWGSLVCGTGKDSLGNSVPLPAGFASWSFRARMANCGDVFGSSAVWDGTTQGNAGQAKWKLVMRTGDLTNGKGREVWLDENTGLIWSSIVATNLNWCKASGNNNIAGNSAQEDDVSNICDQAQNQNTSNSAVSACYEGLGFTLDDPGIDNAGKADLTKSSSLAVGWRLPTIYDYEIGEYNGIRFVLPDMGVALKNKIGSFFEWTATVNSNNKAEAWVVPAVLGGQVLLNRSNTARVRCIGRANILN